MPCHGNACCIQGCTTTIWNESSLSAAHSHNRKSDLVCPFRVHRAAFLTFHPSRESFSRVLLVLVCWLVSFASLQQKRCLPRFCCSASHFHDFRHVVEIGNKPIRYFLDRFSRDDSPESDKGFRGGLRLGVGGTVPDHDNGLVARVLFLDLLQGLGLAHVLRRRLAGVEAGVFSVAPVLELDRVREDVRVGGNVQDLREGLDHDPESPTHQKHVDLFLVEGRDQLFDPRR
mmetsp:Transcript_12635/g.26781  ORF Transcript_12635/g.26781 Transcript_12635/m.26781 type:complete len:230 (-) Transcript_12635:544-1233(-)